MSLVIANGSGHFWTAPIWSSEYPSADKFESAREAKRIAERLAERYANVEVIRDYGLDTQRTVHSCLNRAGRDCPARGGANCQFTKGVCVHCGEGR